MNPYIYLGGAILAEVIGTTLMKFSEGFTRLWPSVGTIICYCASFWLLAQTLAYIPTGLLMLSGQSRYRSDWFAHGDFLANDWTCQPS